MRAFVLAAALAFAGIGHAATPAERDLFRDVYAAAQQGRLSERRDAQARLRDYPLYDYITAADLRYRLRTDAGPALDARIADFVATHPQLPPAQRLKSSWLASLAKRKRWRTLLDHSPVDDASTTARCRATHARIELGMAPRAEALALWRVGRSQPDACDPVFAWLDETGALPPQQILERARLSVLDGHYGMARYLRGKLPDNLAAVVDQWLGVAQTPHNLVYSRQLDGDVAVHAFKRLALSDVDQAANLYPALVRQLGLNADQRYEMQRYLALLYAQNHEAQALVWFARLDHSRMEEHALGWEIRAAVYQQRWPLVVDAIDALPPTLAADEEWRYWKARALAESGHADRAQPIFKALAAKRSYHGYLAADALGVAYSLNERPVPDDDAARARVEAHPALARAKELRALGRDYEARLEWNRLIDDLDKPELEQAARIAYQWQWYSRAIITLVKADYWDDLNIRYPTPYAGAVREYANANRLDPAYVFAIMRTESLFQPEIRSSAGAVGLMQLMPATARHVARDIGSGAPSTAALDVPAANIQFGSRYLRNMLNRWQGNLALATASYNAGPRRIERWLPDAPMDPAIWIANIPYTETRNYVQRAMSHMSVFQRRLGESIVPLDKRIDAIRPAYQTVASD